MIPSTTHCRALPFTMLGMAAFSMDAQHIVTASPDHAHGTGDRVINVVTIEVPPGFSLISSVYLWVDVPEGTGAETASVFDLLDGVPVDWIDGSQGFTPTGGVSSDCATPFPLTVHINAPTDLGTYTATLVDVTGYYDTVYYELNVVDVPSTADLVVYDTLFVDEVGNIVGTAYGTGFDIACLTDYTPEDSIRYHYAFYPPVPWISQTPLDLTVPAWVDDSVYLTLQSNLAGDFVTYRYRSQSWFTLPQIIEYNLHVELSTGMSHIASLPGLESMVMYPNPADQVANIRLTMGTVADGYLLITDAAGREVIHEARALRAGENAFSISTAALPSGIYGCSLVVPGTGSTFAQRLQVVH